jgi:twinkle protein
LYRKQSDFVGKMAKMARRLNVVIILVAHPRKTPYTDLSNDDVSGSADITNKASLVMSYSRIIGKDKSEPDPTERLLTVSKNRLTGKLGNVHMFYSDESKRIVGPDKYFSKVYWGEDDHFNNVSSEDMDEIPF